MMLLYKKYLDDADHLVLNLGATLIFSGLVCVLLNAVTFQYGGRHYLSLHWLGIAPLLLGLAFFSPTWLKMMPNAAFLVKSYSLYFLAFFAFLVMLNGVQYTPFPTADSLLGAADHLLHVKETALLGWAYTHPVLLVVLQIAYHGTVAQWLSMPLLLFLLGAKGQFHFYLTAVLLAYLISAGIYYFFPTIGPVNIFSDTHFNHAQMEVVIEFKEIQRHFMANIFAGGMVAFPSFHATWSTIAVYILRKAPKPLFIAVLLVNLMAIAATLFLGWSYAADIIGGLLIGVVVVYLIQRIMHSRQAATTTTSQY